MHNSLISKFSSENARYFEYISLILLIIENDLLYTSVYFNFFCLFILVIIIIIIIIILFSIFSLLIFFYLKYRRIWINKLELPPIS